MHVEPRLEFTHKCKANVSSPWWLPAQNPLATSYHERVSDWASEWHKQINKQTHTLTLNEPAGVKNLVKSQTQDILGCVDHHVLVFLPQPYACFCLCVCLCVFAYVCVCRCVRASAEERYWMFNNREHIALFPDIPWWCAGDYFGASVSTS